MRENPQRFPCKKECRADYELNVYILATFGACNGDNAVRLLGAF